MRTLHLYRLMAPLISHPNHPFIMKPPPLQVSWTTFSPTFSFFPLKTHFYFILISIPSRSQKLQYDFCINPGFFNTFHPESSIIRTHQSWQWTTAWLRNPRNWWRRVPQQCPTMPWLGQHSIKITTPQVHQERLWFNASSHWGALPR